MSDAVRGRPPAELTPYEAVMRGFGYDHRVTPEEHAEVRDVLERAVRQAPGESDCWAMLSWIYTRRVRPRLQLAARLSRSGVEAARRAVDIAPSNHLAQQALAEALFFRKEMAAAGTRPSGRWPSTRSTANQRSSSSPSRVTRSGDVRW